MTGCASVDPKPFSDFAAGLRTLRDGADAQAGVNVEANRKRLIEQVEAGNISPADLQLGFPTDFGTDYSFSASGEEPLFIKLARLEQGLKALNDAMVSYADLLVTMAGNETVNPADFDTMTDDLNTDIGSAAAALQLKLPAEQQALISTAATKIFEEYIESKRRRSLTAAINEVQPQVRRFAQAGQTAIRAIAAGIKTTYTADLFMPLALANPVDVEAILQLNESTQSTLATLEALWRSYGQLPAAHANLAAAASSRKHGLEALLAFNAEVIRLGGEVSTLTAENESTG
jgi:hypothetical protein